MKEIKREKPIPLQDQCNKENLRHGVYPDLY